MRRLQPNQPNRGDAGKAEHGEHKEPKTTMMTVPLAEVSLIKFFGCPIKWSWRPQFIHPNPSVQSCRFIFHAAALAVCCEVSCSRRKSIALLLSQLHLLVLSILKTIWSKRMLLICDEVASSVKKFQSWWLETSKAGSNGRLAFVCRQGRAKNEGRTKPWRLQLRAVDGRVV